MNILLAVDSAPSGRIAAQSVAARPWPPGSIVRVLTVVEATAFLSEEMMMRGGDLKDMDRRHITAAEGMVHEIAGLLEESFRKQEILAETAIRKGVPRDTIVKEAQDWPADLIVLGSHEHGGLRRLLIGSTAQWVLAHAPCSVEVIHARHAERRLAA